MLYDLLWSVTAQQLETDPHHYYYIYYIQIWIELATAHNFFALPLSYIPVVQFSIIYISFLLVYVWQQCISLYVRVELYIQQKIKTKINDRASDHQLYVVACYFAQADLARHHKRWTCEHLHQISHDTKRRRKSKKKKRLLQHRQKKTDEMRA